LYLQTFNKNFAISKTYAVTEIYPTCRPTRTTLLWVK